MGGCHLGSRSATSATFLSLCKTQASSQCIVGGKWEPTVHVFHTDEGKKNEGGGGGGGGGDREIKDTLNFSWIVKLTDNLRCK